MNYDYYDIQVCTAYVCYLEYGDCGDLSDEEIEQCDRWLERLLKGKAGWFDWSDEESFFGHDEISGLAADVKEAKLYFREV